MNDKNEECLELDKKGTDFISPFSLSSRKHHEKVNVVAGEVAPEVDRPVLAPVSSIMGEILFISLTSDRHSPIDLRTTADTEHAPGIEFAEPVQGERWA